MLTAHLFFISPMLNLPFVMIQHVSVHLATLFDAITAANVEISFAIGTPALLFRLTRMPTSTLAPLPAELAIIALTNLSCGMAEGTIARRPVRRRQALPRRCPRLQSWRTEQMHLACPKAPRYPPVFLVTGIGALSEL